MLRRNWGWWQTLFLWLRKHPAPFAAASLVVLTKTAVKVFLAFWFTWHHSRVFLPCYFNSLLSLYSSNIIFTYSSAAGTSSYHNRLIPTYHLLCGASRFLLQSLHSFEGSRIFFSNFTPKAVDRYWCLNSLRSRRTFIVTLSHWYGNSFISDTYTYVAPLTSWKNGMGQSLQPACGHLLFSKEAPFFVSFPIYVFTTPLPSPLQIIFKIFAYLIKNTSSL